jgi:2-polyprenyl-3-methyl-5-hydroxy-6-metoxy-1,4-benzoquinol methylase
VDPEYGERYRELYQKHWWWRARTELIVDTLRRLKPAQGWNNILDIGCGDGLFFERLSEFGKVEGVETAPELVNAANPHRNQIHICPFDENFRPGKQYSLVLMLDVLEHLENPVAAMRQALNLLTPEGTLVVTVPAFMSLWTNHDVINHHFIRYKKSTFRELAELAGLRIQRERYVYHWTFPVKLAVRLTERALHARPKAPKVPPAWINEMLYRISRAEQKTLNPLAIPFGSSLMIVGAKR